MKLGKIIEARRKELGYSLEEVGKAVGVGKSTVKKWETGAIANMRRDKIALLAEKLELDPALFIGEDAGALISKEFVSGLFAGAEHLSLTKEETKKLSLVDSLNNNPEIAAKFLSDNESTMLKLFRMVPEDRQPELLALIESALKMNGLLQ